MMTKTTTDGIDTELVDQLLRNYQINDPTVADALLDRLLAGAHRAELKGESMRQRAAAWRIVNKQGKDSSLALGLWVRVHATLKYTLASNYTQM